MLSFRMNIAGSSSVNWLSAKCDKFLPRSRYESDEENGIKSELYHEM